jgi:hypothetical protein
MKIPEPIKIKGHYGNHTCTAIPLSDSLFQLKFEGYGDVVRCGGFADDPTGKQGLSFIDPAGGPFIGVGSIAQQYHASLPNRRIKRIVSNEGATLIHIESIDDDLDEPLGVACSLDDPECESCQ